MEDLAVPKPDNIYSLALHMFQALPERWKILVVVLFVVLLVITLAGGSLVLRYVRDARLRELAELKAELERMDDLTVQIGGVLWAVAGAMFANGPARDREQYYRRLWSHTLNALLRTLGTQRNEQHRVSVLVPDDSESNMVWYEGTGFAPDDQEKVRHSIGSMERFGSAAGEAYLTRQPVYIADVRKYEYWEPSTTGHEYRTLYVVPLMAAGECRGVLCVDGKKPGMFSERDRTFVRLFSAIVLGIMGAEARSSGESGGDLGGLQEGEAQGHGLVGGEASA